MIDQAKTQEEKAVQVAEQRTALSFVPRNINQAWRIAEMLSKSNLVPTPLKNKPSDVLVVLMTGRELGMQPMESLRSLHVIEGKPAMSGKAKVARVVRHRDICLYFTFVESTDKVCRIETQRAGMPSPFKLAWTIEQAQKAGLTNKDNWKKYPEPMLRWRCASAVVDAVYPDLADEILIDDEIDEVRASAENGPKIEAARVEQTLADRLGAIDVDAQNGNGVETTKTETIDPETGEITEPEKPTPEPEKAEPVAAATTNPTNTQPQTTGKRAVRI